MSNQKFNIGDTVEIVDWGEGYDSYEEWMKKNASDYLGNFKKHAQVANGTKGEIVASGLHSAYSERYLYLVKVCNNVFIMGEEGLKPITTVAKTYTYKQALKKAIDGYKMEPIGNFFKPYYLEFVDKDFKLFNIDSFIPLFKNFDESMLFQVYLETPKFPIGQPVLSPSNDIGVIRKITHRKSDVIYWVQFNQNNDNLKQFKQAELKEA